MAQITFIGIISPIKDLRVKRAFHNFALLSAENNMKNFSAFKALSCSALVISRENFLKNNCENIWWEWEKSVILHSLNGTSGTPLTTPPSKEIYKILT